MSQKSVDNNITILFMSTNNTKWNLRMGLVTDTLGFLFVQGLIKENDWKWTCFKAHAWDMAAKKKM